MRRVLLYNNIQDLSASIVLHLAHLHRINILAILPKNTQEKREETSETQTTIHISKKKLSIGILQPHLKEQ